MVIINNHANFSVPFLEIDLTNVNYLMLFKQQQLH
jgi:hypothetical protein